LSSSPKAHGDDYQVGIPSPWHEVVPDERISGMRKLWEYLRLVGIRALKDYAWMRDLTIGFIMSAATVALCVYFRLGAAEDWTKHPWFLIFAIISPYLVVICGHVSWRMINSATEMHHALTNKLSQQVSVTGLGEIDPRIEPSFVDGRRGLEQVPYLELKNRGKSVAYFVRLAPLRLKKRTVDFPGYSDNIHPTDFRAFYADAGNQWGEDRKTDIIRAMSEEWCAYEDRDTRREIFVPARIDYEDEHGTRFECNFELMYHGGKGWNQLPTFNCIECRNLVYRRIPLGITPPE
jgi:hypothetical protein